jgi:hypothetical protein
MIGVLILGTVLMAIVFVGVPLGAALLELVASADFANAKAAGVEMVRMLGGEYLAEISCGALAIASTMIYSGLVRVDRRRPEPSQSPSP